MTVVYTSKHAGLTAEIRRPKHTTPEIRFAVWTKNADGPWICERWCKSHNDAHNAAVMLRKLSGRVTDAVISAVTSRIPKPRQRRPKIGDNSGQTAEVATQAQIDAGQARGLTTVEQFARRAWLKSGSEAIAEGNAYAPHGNLTLGAPAWQRRPYPKACQDLYWKHVDEGIADELKVGRGELTREQLDANNARRHAEREAFRKTLEASNAA